MAQLERSAEKFMSMPIHYEKAPVAYRVCAAGINVLTFSVFVMASSLVVGDGYLTNQTVLAARPLLCGFLTVLWLASVVRRSPGSAICLLEVRALGGEPLSYKKRALWSLPYYVFVLVMLVPFGPSQEIALLRAVFCLAGVLALTIDGIALLATGRSLRDRAADAVVLRLSLPAQVKPRLFGRPFP